MKDAIFGFFFPPARNHINVPRISVIPTVKPPLAATREARSLGGMLVSSGALKFSGGGNRIFQ